MFRKNHSARAASGRASLYDDITDKIIAELEAGRAPWVQPWGSAAAKAPLAMPRNAATGRHYSGINVLILWGAVIQHGFLGQSWLTFRQALSLGGNVRKGEHGTTVVYADRFTPEDEKRRARETGEDAAAIPFLKRFTIFNAAQCDGLPDGIAAIAPPPPPGLIEPRVEALIEATGIDFRIGGDRAFYVPAHDYVQVPPPQAYFEPINWHRTALHELGHATGHASRLSRDLTGGFGSRKYAFGSWWPRSTRPSAAPRSASRPPSATPTISAPGSRCCARTIAPSSAPPPRRARRPIGCSAFCPMPISVRTTPRPAMNGGRHDRSENRKKAGVCLHVFPRPWRCPP
jgi:antirestriction protein ArdC